MVVSGRVVWSCRVVVSCGCVVVVSCGCVVVVSWLCWLCAGVVSVVVLG